MLRWRGSRRTSVPFVDIDFFIDAASPKKLARFDRARW
jgi:hypothetical protein